MGITPQHFHTMSTSSAILPPLTIPTQHCSCTLRFLHTLKTDHIFHAQCSNYNVATHNITHSPCTSTCTIHPALPTPLPSTTILFCELNFIAAEHGRYGPMEDCGVNSAMYLVHLVCMNRLSACREFCGVHSWQHEWHKM